MVLSFNTQMQTNNAIPHQIIDHSILVDSNKHLSHSAIQFLSKKTRKPTSDFWTWIGSKLISNVASAYIPLAWKINLQSRHHETTVRYANAKDRDALMFDSDAALPSYFCNYLSYPLPASPGSGRRYGPDVASRVINGGFMIYTYEWDDFDVLSFIIEKCIGGSRKAPIESLYRNLSQFRDFRGMAINWSGCRSPHIHVAFDVRHLAGGRLGSRKVRQDGLVEVPDIHLRPGFMDTWDRLKPIVQMELGIDAEPDPALRQPEQYRRLPGGWRITGEKEERLWGFPVGSCVRQVELWAKLTNRPIPGHGDFLHQAADFLRLKSRPKAPPRGGKRIQGVETKAFLAELRELFARLWGRGDDAPQVAGVDVTGDEQQLSVRITVANGIADQHPSSVVREDHRQILVQSRDAEVARRRWVLPSSPNELWRRFQEFGTLENLLGHRDLRWLEKFGLAPLSVDPSTPRWIARRQHQKATGIAERLIETATPSRGASVIIAPEGLGKSRRIMDALEFGHHPASGCVMCSSPSYRQAEEKCEAWNKHHPNAPTGIVLRSFSATCRELFGSDAPTLNDAVAAGYSSVIDYIYSEKPAMAAALEAAKAAMWRGVRGGDPVTFFTVHALAKIWAYESDTLCWIHPNYVRQRLEENETRRAVIRTRIFDYLKVGWLVLDEINISDLIEVVELDQMEAAQAVEDHLGRRWRHASVADRLTAIKSVAPVRDGNMPSYYRLQAILNGGIWRAERVAADTRDRPLPGNQSPKSPYRAVDGSEAILGWAGWLRTLPTRTTMLSSERRVAVAMERYGAVCTLEEQDEAHAADNAVEASARSGSWSIILLDMPDLPADPAWTVEIDESDLATAEKVEQLVGRVRAAHPESIIISDKVPDCPGVITHVTARGSNEFREQSVHAIYLHPSPEQYRRWLLEGAFLERRCMVDLALIDQFDQTTGRNRGYRAQRRSCGSAPLPMIRREASWDRQPLDALPVCRAYMSKRTLAIMQAALFSTSRYSVRIKRK